MEYLNIFIINNVNLKKIIQLLYGLITLYKKYLTKITNYADEYFLITNTSFNNIQYIGNYNIKYK